MAWPPTLFSGTCIMTIKHSRWQPHRYVELEDLLCVHSRVLCSLEYNVHSCLMWDQLDQSPGFPWYSIAIGLSWRTPARPLHRHQFRHFHWHCHWHWYYCHPVPVYSIHTFPRKTCTIYKSAWTMTIPVLSWCQPVRTDSQCKPHLMSSSKSDSCWCFCWSLLACSEWMFFSCTEGFTWRKAQDACTTLAVGHKKRWYFTG